MKKNELKYFLFGGITFLVLYNIGYYIGLYLLNWRNLSKNIEKLSTTVV